MIVVNVNQTSDDVTFEDKCVFDVVDVDTSSEFIYVFNEYLRKVETKGDYIVLSERASAFINDTLKTGSFNVTREMIIYVLYCMEQKKRELNIVVHSQYTPPDGCNDDQLHMAMSVNSAFAITRIKWMKDCNNRYTLHDDDQEEVHRVDQPLELMLLQSQLRSSMPDGFRKLSYRYYEMDMLEIFAQRVDYAYDVKKCAESAKCNYNNYEYSQLCKRAYHTDFSRGQNEEIKREIMRKDDISVTSYLAMNKTLEHDDFLVLFSKERERFGKTELENLHSELSVVNTVVALIHNDSVPASVLDILASNDDKMIVSLVARHTNTDARTLGRIIMNNDISSKDVVVREIFMNAVLNENFDGDTFDDMFDDSPDLLLQRVFARSKFLSFEQYTTLIDSDDIGVLIHLVRNDVVPDVFQEMVREKMFTLAVESVNVNTSW